MYIFRKGENLCKNYLKGKKWFPGSVVKKTKPGFYKVLLEDEKIIHCHQNQIIKCFIDETVTIKEQSVLTDDLTVFQDSAPIPEISTNSSQPHNGCRYPSRTKKPPA